MKFIDLPSTIQRAASLDLDRDSDASMHLAGFGGIGNKKVEVAVFHRCWANIRSVPHRTVDTVIRRLNHSHRQST
jgi:hypothetical protein